MNFNEWINRQYIGYRGETRATIQDFADYLGVAQSILSRWMGPHGLRPGRKNLAKLADRLGPEIYDVLDLPRPSSEIPLEALPPALRAALIAATREIAAALTTNNIPPASPEGAKMSAEIMSKHGFKLIDTTTPGSE